MATRKLNLTADQLALINRTPERDAVRIIVNDILVRDGVAIQSDITAEVERRLAPIYDELATSTRHYPAYAVAGVLQQFNQHKGWTTRENRENAFKDGCAELAADWIDSQLEPNHRSRFLTALGAVENPVIASAAINADR